MIRGATLTELNSCPWPQIPPYTIHHCPLHQAPRKTIRTNPPKSSGSADSHRVPHLSGVPATALRTRMSWLKLPAVWRVTKNSRTCSQHLLISSTYGAAVCTVNPAVAEHHSGSVKVTLSQLRLEVAGSVAWIQSLVVV